MLRPGAMMKWSRPSGREHFLCEESVNITTLSLRSIHGRAALAISMRTDTGSVSRSLRLLDICLIPQLIKETVPRVGIESTRPVRDTGL